jgi:hypothetical protein
VYSGETNWVIAPSEFSVRRALFTANTLVEPHLPFSNGHWQKWRTEFMYKAKAYSAAGATSPLGSTSIPIQKVNEAYDRLLKSDVKYRFCIDMASLKSE